MHLHNPVLAYENGDEFLKFFHRGRGGQLEPFVLVVEGSIPNEKIKSEGYWAALGTDRGDRTADHAPPNGSIGWRRRRWRSSRSAPARPTAAFTRWQGNPTGCMGLADYLGWDWRSKAGLPIVNVPGCPVQPDNFMETLLYLLYQVAGLAPMIPLDEQLRPTWLFGKTVHEGCDRAGYYEQGDFADRVRLAEVHRQARLLGPGRQLQRAEARLDGRASAAARTSAASASAARCRASPTSSCRSWTSRRARRLSTAASALYGRAIIALRSITNETVNKEPKWRHRASGAHHRLSAHGLI